MNNITRDLIPYSSYPLLLRDENPLTILSKKVPQGTVSLLRKKLEVDKVQARTKVLSRISSYHKDIACTWLHNRHEGEKNIMIITGGEVSERRWFPQGEKGRVITKVSIW